MCDLTDFAGLPLDELMQEIERMKHVRIVKHYPSLLPPTSPGEILSPSSTELGAVGDHFEEINA